MLIVAIIVIGCLMAVIIDIEIDKMDLQAETLELRRQRDEAREHARTLERDVVIARQRAQEIAAAIEKATTEIKELKP